MIRTAAAPTPAGRAPATYPQRSARTRARRRRRPDHRGNQCSRQGRRSGTHPRREPDRATIWVNRSNACPSMRILRSRRVAIETSLSFERVEQSLRFVRRFPSRSATTTWLVIGARRRSIALRLRPALVGHPDQRARSVKLCQRSGVPKVVFQATGEQIRPIGAHSPRKLRQICSSGSIRRTTFLV